MHALKGQVPRACIELSSKNACHMHHSLPDRPAGAAEALAPGWWPQAAARDKQHTCTLGPDDVQRKFRTVGVTWCWLPELGDAHPQCLRILLDLSKEHPLCLHRESRIPHPSQPSCIAVVCARGGHRRAPTPACRRRMARAGDKMHACMAQVAHVVGRHPPAVAVMHAVGKSLLPTCTHTHAAALAH